MLATWPYDRIPIYFLQDGFSAELIDGREMANPERGRPFVSNGAYEAPASVSARSRMERSAVAHFLNRWWKDILANGTKPFLVDDPQLNGSGILQTTGENLLQSDGARLLMRAKWVAMFGSKPVQTPAPLDGMVWDLTYELLLLRRA